MPLGPVRLEPEEIRSEVMSFADNYATAVTQAMDEMQRTTKDPAVAEWALQFKIACALSTYTNAAAPNPLVALLDTVVQVSLRRAALEEHWVPTLLRAEGAPLVETARRFEQEVWALAGRVLTAAQAEEVRRLIEQWKQEHPGQNYVTHVRFTDFSAYRQFADDPGGAAKMPGSVFSLLFMDPPANLDPMAREMRSYRSLTERVVYVSMRMPVVVAWLVENAVNRAVQTPEARRALSATEQLTTTTARFATVAEKLPQDVAKERQAAVGQVSAEVTAHREALLKELDGQHKRLNDLLAGVRAAVGDARGMVADARGAFADVNASTNETIRQADTSARGVVSHAFRAALALVLVLIVGVPAALLLYRYAAARLSAPPPSPRRTGGPAGGGAAVADARP